jgi:predicted metal-dependent phosphoesterase TrpH
MEELKFDFHIHSKYSFDSILSPRRILKRAKKMGLSGIAITDHNTIKGGVETYKINKDPFFTVIIGCEVNTEVGDIIGLFLNNEIQSRQSTEVIDEIHKQEGIVVLPHPFKSHNLNEELIKSVDLLEGINGRCRLEKNLMAQDLARKYNLPLIAGSDAHFGLEIGKCRTIVKIEEGIEKDILRGCKIEGRQNPVYLEHLSQIIKLIKEKNLKKIPFLMIRKIRKYTGRL